MCLEVTCVSLYLYDFIYRHKKGSPKTPSFIEVLKLGLVDNSTVDIVDIDTVV